MVVDGLGVENRYIGQFGIVIKVPDEGALQASLLGSGENRVEIIVLMRRGMAVTRAIGPGMKAEFTEHDRLVGEAAFERGDGLTEVGFGAVIVKGQIVEGFDFRSHPGSIGIAGRNWMDRIKLVKLVDHLTNPGLDDTRAGIGPIQIAFVFEIPGQQGGVLANRGTELSQMGLSIGIVLGAVGLILIKERDDDLEIPLSGLIQEGCEPGFHFGLDLGAAEEIVEDENSHRIEAEAVNQGQILGDHFRLGVGPEEIPGGVLRIIADAFEILGQVAFGGGGRNLYSRLRTGLST